MQYAQIDFFTVLVAAILNMVIGVVWHSQLLFGPRWLRLRKLKDEHPNQVGKMCYAFLTSLVIAYFLALFQYSLAITTVTDGMFVGFCLWLGFVATTQIARVIWCEESLELFAIDAGGKLLSMLAMSGVISA